MESIHPSEESQVECYLQEFAQTVLRRRAVDTSGHLFQIFLENGRSCNTFRTQPEEVRLFLRNPDSEAAIKEFLARQFQATTIAKHPGCMYERIRFVYTLSDPWKEFNGTYGLNDDGARYDEEQFGKLYAYPWSVKHLSEITKKQHSLCFMDWMKELAMRGSEEYKNVRVFVKYWLDHFCNGVDSPALIPEVKGLDEVFGQYRRVNYDENNGPVDFRIFLSEDEYTEARTDELDKRLPFPDPTFFLIDFMAVNAAKELACFIELDGRYHARGEYLRQDSVKRNAIQDLGAEFFFFPTDRIQGSIETCFEEIEEYLV